MLTRIWSNEAFKKLVLLPPEELVRNKKRAFPIMLLATSGVAMKSAGQKVGFIAAEELVEFKE